MIFVTKSINSRAKARKRNRILAIAIPCLIILALILFLALSKDNKDTLLSNSVKASDIEYLTRENAELKGGDAYVYFVAHDKKTNAVQICFSLRKSEKFDYFDVEVSLDEKKVQNFFYEEDATWRRNYFNVILEDVTDFNSIEITYNDKTAQFMK